MPNNSSQVKKKSGGYWATYKPPELPEAEQFRQALERVRRMTPEEIFQSSVDVGIHNPDGTLTEHYRDEQVVDD